MDSTQMVIVIWEQLKTTIIITPDNSCYFNFSLWKAPILAKSIRSKDRTWESLIVQASIWCVDPCSSGLDLQELQKFSTLESKGGPQWKNDFTEVPPLVHGQKFFCSSWRSRPQEHGSTYHGEACTIKLFHVLIFDLINFAKIGLWNESYKCDSPSVSISQPLYLFKPP